MQWNAQSILANKLILIHFLLTNNIHIAIISETWLKPNKKLKIKNYSIERNDSGNKHNGVAILIHNSIRYTNFTTSFDNSLQNICVVLNIFNKNISIVSMYCPTNSTPNFSKAKFDVLIKSIPEPMIFAGDFNAHHTAWGSHSVTPRGRDILDVIDDNGLVLLNTGELTTVGTPTWRPSALDLTVVSPSLALSCDWSVHNDPLGSYHLPVILKISLGQTENTSTHILGSNIPKWPNYKWIDWDLYKKTVDEMLQNFSIDDAASPNEIYRQFCTTLHMAIHASLPQNKKTNSSTSTSTNSRNIVTNNSKKPRIPLPWWNGQCDKAVEDSRKAFATFKNDPTVENYINFKHLQALKKLTLKRERDDSWIKLCETFNRHTPLSVIWNHMKKFNKTFVNRHINNDNNWITTFLEKFTPDFVDNMPNKSDNIATSNNTNNFIIQPFSIQELKSAITTRRDTAFGLDGIPYKFLKNLNNGSMNILLNLFNLLWRYNCIPIEWKTDCLIPVLKHDKEMYNPDSYRPIALTSCMGKVFEQLIKQRIEFFVEKHHILPSNQFGFRRGRSARESISHLQLDIQQAMHKNESLACIFFDVVGAFNNVDHEILYKELLSIGLPEKIINWIYSFLHGRVVYAKFNNNLFGPRYSYKGTCQGSILSPIIFLLYIHSINSTLGSDVSNLQYADDLVIYCSGNNQNQIKQHLNNALKKLEAYFSYLNLNISASKSKVVCFGKKRNTNFQLYYDNNCIPIVTEAKFLGVTFTNNLSWIKYVDYLVCRASKAFNILKTLCRIYWGADPKILLSLYKSLVRSHFEYGFLCFASNHKLLDKIEKLQNNNLRLITGAFRTTPINSMEVECNLPPLRVRFKYMKFRFILKMSAISKHPLLAKLKSICSSPSTTLDSNYLVQDFSEIIQLIESGNLYKNENWPCYQGSYESKYPEMEILINKDLTDKYEVLDAIAKWPNYRSIYTDGSKTDDSVGEAFYDSHKKIGHGRKIDGNTSIFTAEALAIVSALQYIDQQETDRWIVASDSMSVLTALQHHRLDTVTNYVIYKIKSLWNDLHLANKHIVFLWVPAHRGVTGNENADFLARTITTNAFITSDKSPVKVSNDALPFTDLVRILKDNMKIHWQKCWEYSTSIAEKGQWYAAIDGTSINKIPWFTKRRFINRRFYSIINRLRLGHCRFNAHLHRMKMIDSPLCDVCGIEDQTLDHIIFNCTSFSIQRLLLMDKLLDIFTKAESIPRSIQQLLQFEEAYIPIFEYIHNTLGDI